MTQSDLSALIFMGAFLQRGPVLASGPRSGWGFFFMPVEVQFFMPVEVQPEIGGLDAAGLSKRTALEVQTVGRDPASGRF